MKNTLENLYTQMVLEQAKKMPQKEALQTNNSCLTYNELDKFIQKTALVLHKYQLKTGERVLLLLDKSIEYIIAFLSITTLGAVVVPVEPGEGEERIKYITKVTNPRLILLGQNTSLFKMDIPQIRIMISNKQLKFSPSDNSNSQDFELPLVTARETAAILFSSGSTGKPKGVVLRHQHLLAAARNVAGAVKMNENTRDLILSPLNHSDGWQRVGATLISGGSAFLYQDVLSIVGILNKIQSYKITSFFTPPPLIRYILATASDKVQKFTLSCTGIEIGSAPISPAELKELQSKIPTATIFIHYGLTEASRATILDTRLYPHKLNTVGKTSFAVEVKICNPDGKTLNSEQEGEICLKGPQCSDSYWQEETLNQERYRDGWLYTGDFGKLDQDGFLTFLGRRDDLITSGGYHYFPAEVELSLGQVDGVQRYCIIGVKDEKGILEQVPWAFVVAENQEWQIKTFLNQAKNKLPSYMLPRKIVVVPYLPLTNSGKVKRKQTINLYLKKDGGV